MTGRELVEALEREGFSIKRRSRSFVWISRGQQTLMLDVEANVPESFLHRLLGPRSLRPPSSGRRSPASRRHSGVHSKAPSSKR